MDVNPSSLHLREQEERVAVVVAIGLGLFLIPLLFAWLVPASAPALWGDWFEPFADRSSPAPAPVVVEPSTPLPLPADSSADDAKAPNSMTEMAARAATARVMRMERENADLQSRISTLEEKLGASVPVSEAERLEKENLALKGVIEHTNATAKRNQTLAEQRAVDVTKARAEAQTLRSERDRLAASEASLRKQLDQASAGTKAAQAEQAKLQTQLEQARAAAASSLDANGKKTLDDLTARLATAEKDRDAAMSELERMVVQNKDRAMSSSEVGVELQRTREQLLTAQDRIRQLEEKLAAQPGARSEVRSETFRKASDWNALPAEAKRPGDLWIGALPLFQTLKQSTSAKETVDVRDAYVQANRLGTLLARIYFPDGTADLGPKGEGAVKTATSNLPPNAYLLVVGYASVKGDANYNENLSSLRAQNVVQRVRPLVQNGKVQMVYFGETTQFDSRDMAKNRVVELWRIDN